MKYSPRVIINYVIFTFLFTGAALIVWRGSIDGGHSEPSYPTLSEAESVLFVIDPGHGGEDGGASNENVLEKDLNLTISECLSDICTVFGYSTRLTRTEDTLLYDYYDDLDDYTGRKKAYDLRNRLRLAEEVNPSLFIGIHMNKFPVEKYRGLQVYYSPNTDESKIAASIVQSYSKKFLDNSNDRQIKPSTNAIYILKRIKLPAMLIECGFLSNPDECAALTSPNYQIRLASSIFAGCAEFIVGETK